MRTGENIFKRKDGRWEARYHKGRDPSGKLLYGFCYGKTYSEAKARMEEAKKTVPAWTPFTREIQRRPLHCFCEEWLRINQPRLHASTYVKYQSVLEKYIRPHFGGFYPDEVTSQAISDFSRRLLGEKNLAPKTVNDILLIFHSVLEYTRKNFSGRMNDIEIIYPKKTHRKTRVLSVSEQKILTEYLLADMDLCKFGVLLSLWTGLRIGEICALRCRNISLCDESIQVESTMQRLKKQSPDAVSKTLVLIGPPKSPASVRLIPLTEQPLDLCKKMLPAGDDAFVLSGTTRYIEPRALQFKFQKYVDDCNLKDVHPDDPDNYIPNYNTIVGVNADFYNMTTGQPSGALVMEGVTYQGVGSENFFAILDDGTPVIGSSGDWAAYEGRIKEAVGGSIFLVKNGEIAVSTSADYYNSRASRTCVGITADGKVVLMALDGRQEPFSAGGSAEEIAQIMLDAGCYTAINLDGGGSTTFAAKEEGADSVTIVNRPSDGYERSVSSSLLVVSTARTSNEFDHALLSTDTDYLTIGSSLQVTVSGVSESGNAAEVPEGAFLRVSDESVATLSEGVITAVAKGNVDVELVVGETVVGSKTLHVVVPDSLVFQKENLSVIYGVPTRLPLLATYQGNPVTINENDILTGCEYEEAGVIEGFMFTGIEESGIRTMLVAAVLLENEDAYCEIQVSMYKNGEAIFDFDTATEGNRAFAWNRDVSNSTTDDGTYYHIVDPEQEMNISYIFALDMKEIEIPEQIKPLMSLLPGGDDPNATAWDFLLQLAERVSVLTEVRVQLHVDPNLELDFSEMTLVNEYFTMTSTEFDEETHTLTVVCNWIDQTQAIDSATANSICILSGIKAVPKADAQWDENECLAIENTGEVSYGIYLRSSTLYSVASDPSIQETYGLIPFINPYDSNEKGAHFGTTYATFEDSFTLDKSNWQGWRQSGDDLYYFVDNIAVTGIRQVPGYQDEENSYYYNFGENGVSQGKITGLFELNGDTYYAINGTLKTGWRPINNTVTGETDYYYFDLNTGRALDGEQTIGGYHYIFTDRNLTRGDLIHNEKGVKYMWAGHWVSQQWMTVDGKEYYFRSNEYAATGVYAFNIEGKNVFYAFDENGVWQKDRSGLYDDKENTYLIENGIIVDYPGLVVIDGDYYYFAYYRNGLLNIAVKGCTYWITKTNGLLPEGSYTFDEDGKMVNPPVVDPDPEDPEVKNGIVAENGSLYYYENGVLTYAGLIQIDGDYYYVRGTGEAVHGRSYWITKTNGLLPEGSYTFDENGKMVNPPVTEPEVKSGIVAENGSLYYYENGVLTYAGLIQIDGDYYYVRGTGEVVNNRTYWITKTNGLLPEGSYTFDENGKMVNPPVTEPDPDPIEPEPEVKNGIVAENGSLYYYENGNLVYAGLIQIDGDYYYVRGTGEVVHGRSYWITKTNGLLPEGSYTFDENGKMVNPPVTEPDPEPTPDPDPTEPEPEVKNGIVAENGSLYYYENGVLTYAGLIQIDGDYYYVRGTGEAVHGRSYWITKTNGLLPEASYNFDDSGRIVF